MRVRTLEIRWHDQKPISTCDFQPMVPARKSRLPKDVDQGGGRSYRLATGGEDNNVRMWLVRPNILPPFVAVNARSSPSGSLPAPHPPRVEYRSTLSKHSGAVNVVRFSPNGELVASAGDGGSSVVFRPNIYVSEDGMIIIWAPTDRPPAAVYGSESVTDEDPEHWKVRISFRCTTNEIYDLAWSPTGEYVIAGSTDNAARIFSVTDGTCVRELAEHNHYVQGVAWDPMNEFIATQSSDRAVHVHSISTKHGVFETHAVGKNSRMHVRHSRTPSTNTSRPRSMRRSSTASDAESAITAASEYLQREESLPLQNQAAPLTPATSIAGTPTMFPPPQVERSSSRRSSFSGSNAAGSPAPSNHGHFGRSPSPMPPLPAIRAQSTNASTWSSVKLYGDESFTNFFRRLTFSPDGAMLLTPAGQFEDPSVIPGASSRLSSKHSGRDDQPSRGCKTSSASDTELVSASSVYIYTRASFGRPPVAHLPGHRKASVAVKFSPMLYELRQNVRLETPTPQRATIERGRDSVVDVDIAAPMAHDAPSNSDSGSPKKTPLPTLKHAPSPLPTPAPALHMPSPTLSATSLRPPTPATVPPASTTASVFALPYRMLFAIATMDTITIYDTQQAGPVCMFTKLHYDEFTDMTWSPDGQCLMLSSRDGFCTIIVLDEHLPAYHTQQHTLQLQSLAHAIGPHQPSPVSTSATIAPLASTLPAVTGPSIPLKRPEPPMTPLSHDDNVGPSHLGVTFPEGSSREARQGGECHPREPAKKKRRVALTRIGDLDQ